MKSKIETRHHVVDFINLIENQLDCHVKTVRSDNSLEFIIPQLYAAKSILHQTSCVETPQQNSRAKRMHQHILNITRDLFFRSNLPKTFRSYVIVPVVFTMNRVLSPLLQNNSSCVLVSLTQLVGTLHNICRIRGPNPEHHKKKKKKNSHISSYMRNHLI